MERIGKEYHASTIADMLNSRHRLIADHEEQYRNSSPLNRALAQVVYLGDRLAIRQEGEQFMFPLSEWIIIPMVRHLPARDRLESGCFLTLFDETAECEVSYNEHNFVGDSVKRLSWGLSMVSLTYTAGPYENNKYDTIHLNHVYDMLKGQRYIAPLPHQRQPVLSPSFQRY